ncbi:hypothetical protein [Phenylobacterium aquaticum]|uniref:hypothetical protein n=1 Tax=Phenylobacterium aquaticum TaxID=1763816 RepID=UPI0026F209CF|nr:hypothetical protein [Phenylobacterium aquaticum]
MNWKDVVSEFEWDGSWRDIYVVGATVDDWQRVLDALARLSPSPTFYIDGKPAPMPVSVKSLFEQRALSAPLLRLEVGHVGLKSHFFDEEEIEFDLDPREVKGPAELEALSDFMRLLADRTGKVATLTHENTKSAVILAVAPGA